MTTRHLIEHHLGIERSRPAAVEYPPTGETYVIRTLQDLWQLGSAEQIERAFREISFAMVRARRYQDDVLVAASEALMDPAGTEPAPSSAIEWPTEIHWKDDGRGQFELKVRDATGQSTRVIVDSV